MSEDHQDVWKGCHYYKLPDTGRKPSRCFITCYGCLKLLGGVSYSGPNDTDTIIQLQAVWASIKQAWLSSDGLPSSC